MKSQVAFVESAAALANGSLGICNSSAQHFPALKNFYAFGDSYSAGIGANCGWVKDEFDLKGACLKCQGAYTYQIIEVANASDCMEVYHVGCTGASMTDILETGWNNRTSQLELMNSTAGQGGWGTLSIGGNDVGFAHIVANCIMFDRPTCDADLEFTEDLISDPLLLSRFTETYLRVLGAANDPDFRLIVPGYAQFFNAETEICDNQYIFYGRYLTQEFRTRLNKMISDLNLVIQIAVAIVQMQLVFSNSGKGIYYEDWDSLFWGHRFCEEAPKGWTDAWFFTINGPDTLPNGTIISAGTDPPEGEGIVNITSLASSCDGQPQANLTAQMLCDWALKLEDGIEPNWNVSSLGYPWWITKTLHPKSIAHWQLGKMIYKKWMNGDYT
jgi:hypothetical protein